MADFLNRVLRTCGQLQWGVLNARKVITEVFVRNPKPPVEAVEKRTLRQWHLLTHPHDTALQKQVVRSNVTREYLPIVRFVNRRVYCT